MNGTPFKLARLLDATGMLSQPLCSAMMRLNLTLRARPIVHRQAKVC
jgi:hypothetical protein